MSTIAPVTVSAPVPLPPMVRLFCVGPRVSVPRGTPASACTVSVVVTAALAASESAMLTAFPLPTENTSPAGRSSATDWVAAGTVFTGESLIGVTVIVIVAVSVWPAAALPSVTE